MEDADYRAVAELQADGVRPECIIYKSDYTGGIRFALRWADPSSSTGWRYSDDWDKPARSGRDWS